MLGNVLRRGERSWLCVKIDFGFTAGHGWREVMQIHSCESEFGRKGRGGGGNMLRRGESSWLCVKIEFGFHCGPR
jgi:hypothetical protein